MMGTKARLFAPLRFLIVPRGSFFAFRAARRTSDLTLGEELHDDGRLVVRFFIAQHALGIEQRPPRLDERR